MISSYACEGDAFDTLMGAVGAAEDAALPRYSVFHCSERHFHLDVFHDGRRFPFHGELTSVTPDSVLNHG